MQRYLQKLENEDDKGATIWIFNTIIKYTIIWIFIIELASKASPSQLLKIQDEEYKIDKDTETEEDSKPM